MPNDVQTLQAAAEAWLEADTELAGIEVISEDRGDLETAIELALAQLGICIVVGTLRIGCTMPGVPGPVFDKVTMTCSVTENVTINRSGDFKDALSVAIRVAQRLHHWKPSGTAFDNRTCTVDASTIEYQQQGDLLAYDVNFNF